MLAIAADSDPGAVYEQHRWLGAVVAAGAVCAFAAMLGWATLRQGGVPAPLLLVAVVAAGIPFTLPAGLFVPAAVLAVAACAALATAGLARPPASARAARRMTGGLAALALALAIGQAVVVGLHGSSPSRVKAHVASTHVNAHPVRARRKAHRRVATPRAAATRFVRAYYARLDARRFDAAWKMLAPGVRTGFGGLAAWRKGYARTISSRPEAIRVTAPTGSGATVGLTLLAADRGACGTTLVHRFAVTWQLARTESGWRAAAAVARQLPGAAPAAAC
jgi:hypothetical protein